MWLLLAFASSFTFGAGTFIFKISADRRCLSADVLFGLYLSGTLMLLILTWPIDFITLSLTTLIIGLVVATGSTLGNSLYLKVLQTGPASLSAPLINCSNLLIVIMSVLLFNEELSIYAIGSIILFFVAMGFLTFDPNERLVIKDKNWYWLVIAATICIFFREGGLKIAEEIGMDTILILLYAYLTALLFNGYLVFRRTEIVQETTKQGFLFGILVGLFSAGGLALFAEALTLGPASLIAPIFATRSVVVVLLAVIFCKERLSIFQTLSIIILSIATILLFI